MPYFAFPACTAFVLPVKLSVSQSMSFFTFFLFSPHTRGKGSEQAAGWVLSYWPWSTHHISFMIFPKPEQL